MIFLSACAHVPAFPKQDRSPGLDLSPIAKRFGVPRCTVSVPLTREEVLRAAGFQGDIHTRQRPQWAAMVAAYQPRDQFRQVTCLTKGPTGVAAGDVFYGLFRHGAMIEEMHAIIID